MHGEPTQIQAAIEIEPSLPISPNTANNSMVFHFYNLRKLENLIYEL